MKMVIIIIVLPLVVMRVLMVAMNQEHVQMLHSPLSQPVKLQVCAMVMAEVLKMNFVI